MGFVQFYFGLPIAMIVICNFYSIYHKYKVYIQYLEQRFDLKTRSLAAILFLFQRGLGTGLTIYTCYYFVGNFRMEPHLYEYRYWCSGYILHILRNKSSKRNAKQQMFVIMSGMLITNSAFLTK
jgi:hypothetical protein